MVQVRPGYMRNHLYPGNKAVYATAENVEKYASEDLAPMSSEQAEHGFDESVEQGTVGLGEYVQNDKNITHTGNDEHEAEGTQRLQAQHVRICIYRLCCSQRTHRALR
jgi:Ribosomal protein L9, N-terminal domain